MSRLLSFFTVSLLVLSVLSACSLPVGSGKTGADGLPLPSRYKIRPADRAQIPERVLSALNAQRAAQGLVPVQISPSLTDAAKSHARDMSAQNRPWNFGSDGSSPPVRAVRAGYSGRYIGEAIAESFESELETLAAWLSRSDTRAILLDPEARYIGLGWKQERDGKLWWVLEIGA